MDDMDLMDEMDVKQEGGTFLSPCFFLLNRCPCALRRSGGVAWLHDIRT
jgi:hypothetical protein